MRASDNPSPPPRPHTTVSFDLVMKDGQTPFPDISAPPSPFRPINLRERLDQFTAAECALSPEPRPEASSDQHLPLQDSNGVISQPDLMSFESCSALVKMLPTEPFTEGHSRASPVQNVLSGATSNIDDLLAQSPQRLPNMPSPPRVDGIEQSNSSDSLDKLRQGVPVDADSGPPPSSSSPLIANLCAPDIIEQRTSSPVRRSARLSVTPLPLRITHAQQPSESKLKGKFKATTLLAEGKNSTIQDEQTDGQGSPDPFPHSQRSPEEKERRSRRRGLNGKLETPNLKRELGSLSPQSAEVLARLLPAEGSTPLPVGQSSQPQRDLFLGSLDPPPSTPQRPDSNSRPNLTAIHRPLFVAPTPIRLTGGLSGPPSPLKFSVTVDDVSRTPARRVPIQDAFVQGSASAQNAMLLSAKRDASTRLTMRGPVFSRPASDDAPRSPAKRVLIAELNTPVRSPARPVAAKARSASAEPKPLFPQPARSRSVDPSPQASRITDSKGRDRKGKEPMFPKPPSKPRPGAKLPFPLVPGQKAGTDLPHSIPEEAEGPEAVGEDAIANEAAASSSPVKSSLKKPSTGSRIPRIGAKPYARPQPRKPAATKLPAFGTGPVSP